METKLSKRMSVFTGLVIFFGVVNVGLLLVQAEAAVGGIWTEPEVALAKWNENILGYQVLLLSGRTLFGVITNVLAMLFMLHSIKLMKCGEFFSKRNATIIWCAAPVYFLYSLCSDNMPIVYGVRNAVINSDSIFIPLLLIGIAMIYSTGVRLSEENRWTV